LPDAAQAAFLRVGRKVYLEVRSLMEERRGVEYYARIQAPVLLLNGADSPLAARRVGGRLAAGLPEATLEIVEGAGHMGPITHADRVNARLDCHLREAAR
jgi:pimeloyl-ACP methyl ester carboxylesterase